MLQIKVSRLVIDCLRSDGFLRNLIELYLRLRLKYHTIAKQSFVHMTDSSSVKVKDKNYFHRWPCKRCELDRFLQDLSLMKKQAVFHIDWTIVIVNCLEIVFAAVPSLM